MKKPRTPHSAQLGTGNPNYVRGSIYRRQSAEVLRLQTFADSEPGATCWPGMTGFAGHTDCDPAVHMLLNFCP